MVKIPPPPKYVSYGQHYINIFSSCFLLSGGATSMFHVRDVHVSKAISAISFVSQQISESRS